jgi:hypothetical protein
MATAIAQLGRCLFYHMGKDAAKSNQQHRDLVISQFT